MIIVTEMCDKCGNYRPIFNNEWICDLTQETVVDFSKLNFTNDLVIEFKPDEESYAIVDGHKISTLLCVDEMVKRGLLVKHENQETKIYVKDGDEYRTELRKCTVYKSK